MRTKKTFDDARLSIRLLLFIIVVNIGILPSTAQSIPVPNPSPLETDLPTRLDALVANYWKPRLTAAFGTFTFDQTGLPSPFSRWLEERLGGALSKSGRLSLFNRSAAAAMDPALKAVYGDFFEKSGVDALIAGRFRLEPGAVAVHFELTGLSDGILIGTSDILVPAASLPPGIEVEPRAQVAAAAASLGALVAMPLPAANTALKVSTSTERGAGAVYREGENLVVLASVDQPAYLRIFHISALGTVQLIWPNRFGGGSGAVRAGQVLRIPGSGDSFDFRMEAPFGTEFIKVLASTQPFAGTEADFTDLGGDARTVITRGLPPPSAAGQATVAEALATYVIVPAK